MRPRLSTSADPKNGFITAQSPTQRRQGLHKPDPGPICEDLTRPSRRMPMLCCTPPNAEAKAHEGPRIKDLVEPGSVLRSRQGHRSRLRQPLGFF